MATVTITIEDIMKNGKEGLRVVTKSDPEFPTEVGSELTIAQAWSLDMVEQILDHAEDVTESDPDQDKH